MERWYTVCGICCNTGERHVWHVLAADPEGAERTAVADHDKFAGGATVLVAAVFEGALRAVDDQDSALRKAALAEWNIVLKERRRKPGATHTARR